MKITKLRTEYKIEHNDKRISVDVLKNGNVTIKPYTGRTFIFEQSKPEVVEDIAYMFSKAAELAREEDFKEVEL